MEGEKAFRIAVVCAGVVLAIGQLYAIDKARQADETRYFLQDMMLNTVIRACEAAEDEDHKKFVYKGQKDISVRGIVGEPNEFIGRPITFFVLRAGNDACVYDPVDGTVELHMD